MKIEIYADSEVNSNIIITVCTSDDGRVSAELDIYGPRPKSLKPNDKVYVTGRDAEWVRRITVMLAEAAKEGNNRNDLAETLLYWFTMTKFSINLHWEGFTYLLL